MGGGEETLISFPAVPIDKEIYVKASLFKNNSLVYSGKTEVIKVVKGDNRVKLALDKSYMVTFSWEGKTKQIEVKSGNLIPVSEIPEIYAPDGKAVVWYNGNNAFSFSNGINEELSLSSKVVDITAETVCDVIKSCYGDMEQLVKLQGNCSSDLVIKMGAALKENPNAKIILDLGDVSGLTEIPQEALAANNALFGIILPKTGLTKIGYWALGALYNVKNIEIPASVTEIDKAAFQECISLESIVIPEGIAQISERTFNWCKNLETITIPVTVTSIGFEAFNGCEALTTINYAGTKALWDEIFIDDKNECLSKATINYGNISEIPTETVEVAVSEAASRIAGLSGRNRVIMTGECSSETVSQIGNALKNSSAQVLLDLSDVSGLTEIPQACFRESNSLVEITLPECVTNINNWTFAYSNLRAINIPANVEYIANEAFVGCVQLTNIDVAENNSYFSSENGVIYNKEKSVLLSYPSASGRVEFLDSVIRIGDYAFKNSRIETLNIPDHITSMGVGAFYNCYSLTSVESFGGVSSIPNLAFYCCTSLESITVPENIISIGSSVFDCCVNLKDVEIQGNISVIDDRTFYNCRDMNTISIPASVTEIKDGAFLQCEALETVNYAGTEELWIQISIGDNNDSLSNATINYGNITEVPEIPEIPVTEISVEASAAANTIAGLSGRNLVIVTGNCSSETVSDIGNALKNSGAQILLDLSGVSGLTSIPQEAFAYNSSLVEITLPDGVTTIERWCFSDCGKLQSITIPASVELIEIGAFAGCPKLTNIVIEDGNNNYFAENGAIYSTDGETLVAYPSASGELTIDISVSRIGNYAFNGSNITSLIIPESVTEIEWSAFGGCEYLETVDIQANIETIPGFCFGWCGNLQSITIPASVERIQDCAFIYCQNLTDIRISGNNFIEKDGAIYTADERTLVAYPTAIGSVEIPETVKTIGAGAFAGSLVDSITISESVTTIESEAFRECELLYSINIPETVTSIEYNAFNNCKNLQTVEILAKVSILPQGMFVWCENLTSVTIPATVTSIEWGVFDGCSSLSTVTYTGTEQMWDTISIGNENSYLENASLTCTGEFTEVPEIPVTEISVEASEAADTIYNLSGRNLVIVTGECDSNTVSQIGNALRDSGAQILLDLRDVNGLTSIPSYCFSDCENLQSITIPASVELIENGAFARCPKLTNIVIEDGNNNYYAENGAIYTTDGATLVAYPSASGTVVIPDGVTTIESRCFCDCSNLQSITIPSSVTSIGHSAFIACNNLTNIVIEAGNNNYFAEDGAIYTTDGATLVVYPSASGTVEIPYGVTTIGNGAFACSLIEEIILPNSLTEIGDSAFHACTSLESISIPSSVTKISQEAFNCCSGLTSIVIPANVTTIEHGVFHECRNLQSVEILGNISVIQSRTFENCESLESITIPATVTSIEWDTFYGCEALSNVTYTGTEQMWNDISKQDGNSYLQNASLTCTGEFTEVPEIPVTEISVAASEAADTIAGLSGRNLVIVTGDCDSGTVSAIGNALRENYNAQIFLDLSDVSGLTVIPQGAFAYNSSLVEITLPDGITTIESWCFGLCGNLQSITIPSSVERIESCAFIYCQNLTDISISGNNFIVKDNAIYTADGTTLVAYPSASGSVEIPETVTTIGAGAFAGSLVNSITIPESVTTIGREAFRECRNFQTVEILANVSVLPGYMFSYCENLTSVTIPATVTSIEWDTFYGCEALTTINYAGTEELWIQISIGDNNDSLSNATINYGNITEVPEIPVTEISVEASEAADTIYNLSGRNLVIVTGDCSSETVSDIGNALRENYNVQIFLDLSDVNGLTSIPQNAFAFNDSLVEITLPECVTEIGGGAFNQCRYLQSVNNLGNISTIPSGCFSDCGKLQSITIPASVELIEIGAFTGCPKLTNIVIENGNNNYFAENGAIYTTDGETLVAYPSASGELTIDSSVSRIGNYAFNGSNITSLIIPESVTEIEWSAFGGCEYLETVDIRANIGTIPEWAFGSCRNLKSITIPSSVQRIESCAFAYCQNLTDISISGNNFIVEDNAIYTADETTLVAYPTASGSVEIPETVKTIGAGAFAGSLVDSITIPESVTTIENEAFRQCELLYSISIPETVTSIGHNAFNCCNNLSSVTFEDTTGWYVSEYQDSGSDGDPVDVTTPSTNAGLLVGDYCYYYWTKVEE